MLKQSRIQRIQAEHFEEACHGGWRSARLVTSPALCRMHSLLSRDSQDLPKAGSGAGTLPTAQIVAHSQNICL